MEGNKKIKIGDVFGDLTIIKYVGKNKDYRHIYLCECSCTNKKEITDNSILTGRVKSCGCLKKRNLTKHGLSKTKIYQVWQQMIKRCYKETDSNYYKYGAKRIEVCEEWRNKENGFVNFYEWSMLNGYKEGLTIDRKNTYSNYDPNNCRWVTYEVQNTNLRPLKNNKSGYRGCFYITKDRKWKASVSINNKTKHIGVYNTLKECVIARNNYIDDNNLPHQKNIWIEEEDNKNV